MCPKIGVIQDADLGNIRMPSRLMDLLENYCLRNHATKSVAVRDALAALVKADMQTIMENCELDSTENMDRVETTMRKIKDSTRQNHNGEDRPEDQEAITEEEAEPGQ